MNEKDAEWTESSQAALSGHVARGGSTGTPRCVAQPALRRVARDLRNASYVDTSGRQDPLALTPKVNHWWHAALYVTSRGITTSPIPYGNRTFELTFDFISHTLVVQTSDGEDQVCGTLSTFGGRLLP